MKKNHLLLNAARLLNAQQMKQVKGGSFLGWRCASEWRCIAYYTYSGCESNCRYGGCFPNSNAACTIFP